MERCIQIEDKEAKLTVTTLASLGTKWRKLRNVCKLNLSVNFAMREISSSLGTAFFSEFTSFRFLLHTHTISFKISEGLRGSESHICLIFIKLFDGLLGFARKHMFHVNGTFNIL